MRILSRVLSLPIHVYRRFISPATPPCCRYSPSCSSYALEALTVHGPFKGLALAAWRVLRCNPWSHGGVDRVPAKGRWKSEEWVPPEDWAGHLDLDPPFPMGLERIEDWDDGTTVSPRAIRAHAAHSHEDGPALVTTQTSPETSGLTVDAAGVRPS
ncbi:membrane protein insertion efficiency factor YidD [Schaalia sp. 19OD2882]|uniref:membrane protein insertion efficiency factor YidD n=1 Tax=Schaalia sp. 19OD2882 TaxID=2794089 RepID=UPI001C1E9F98|nr:membrane protein insertion efficiency factor YidD [Schaalia sp. 19OD2882]QWW19573.1 membrane protein insertion efficiency factor YidD [Schaalia sp. 19OD2882]